MKWRKLFAILLFGLLICDVPASYSSGNAYWVTIWQDDFADDSSVYADAYNLDGISASNGYLFVRNTKTDNFQPQGKIRGLHPLPVFNFTIEFTSYVPRGVAVYYFRLGYLVTDPGNRFEPSLSESTNMGAIFEIYMYADGNNVFRVHKWYGGVDEFNFLNATDNVLELKWDGVNWKVGYTLDGNYLGEWDFYHRANRTGAINPMLFSGEFEFYQYYSTASTGFKINRIVQRTYVADDRVYGVAGKFMGFQWDDQTSDLWSQVTILDQHNASVTLDVRYDTVGLSGWLSWSQIASLVKDKKWEIGLHTGTSLKVPGGNTILQNTYNWVKNNLTNQGLTVSEASPKVFTALGCEHNWTHSQFGWANLGVAVRTSLMPYMRYTNNQTGASICLVPSLEAWYDWAINQTRQGGRQRAFFAFAHPPDFTPSWFDGFLTKLDNAGYRTIPVWRGYKSLLNSHNCTFTVITSTTSTLSFSTSTGGFDVYVWARKPSGSGTWYVYDDLNQRIKIYENLSDKVGFWVEHGRTYTMRSTKLDGSIESLSPHYASIISSSLTNAKLAFTVSAPSGSTSTTKIYVGEKGEPLEISGATSSSYDESSRILTIIVFHSDSVSITVRWKLTGDINDDEAVNETDLSILNEAFGSTGGPPSSANWNPEADLNEDNLIAISDLYILSKNYGKTS